MRKRPKEGELIDDLPDDGYVSEEDEDYDPTKESPAEARKDQEGAEGAVEEGELANNLRARKQQKLRQKAEAHFNRLSGDAQQKGEAKLTAVMLGRVSGSNSVSSWERNLFGTDDKGESLEGVRSREGLVGAAKEALGRAGEAISTGGSQEKGGEVVKVAETRDFAGEEVKVEQEYAAGSAQAKQAEERERRQGAEKGFDAVLAMINGKKKLSTLDKSRLDWGSWKRQQGAAEEADLERHVRSGGTHLEKKDFLHRAEWAEYERDRDAKLASDPRTRIRAS